MPGFRLEPRTPTTRLPRTARRSLLTGAAAGAAAAIAAGLLRPGQGLTANMQIGVTNDAGGSTTEITSSTANWTFLGTNTAKGNGLEGQSAGGRGVYGYSDPGGYGVYAESPSGVGLYAEGDLTGVKARAFSFAIDAASDGTAILADGGLGIQATGRTTGVSAIGDAFGVAAVSAIGTGVWGSTGKGVGVLGDAAAPNGIAIHATAHNGAKALLVEGGATEIDGPVTVSDSIKAVTFAGSGAGLSALDASSLAAGTVADARLSPNIPRLSTGLPASSLTGTIDDARQSKNVALKNRPNNTFKGQVIARVFAGAPRSGGAPAFAKAGTATVAKGQDRVSVTTSALRRGVSVLATPQNLAGAGAAIAGVEKHAGGFDIVLTAPARTKTQVAYFLFRQG